MRNAWALVRGTSLRSGVFAQKGSRFLHRYPFPAKNAAMTR
ncbi:hypothetical protein D557_1771 [Bordetella holmesii 70147]|nr:hypothetical protein D560_2514 [Bordetella holmesii ATCC 51541]AIT27155.1 hypothetical protein D558_2494 [Bordetella holmesii 44057]EWM51909.1 hypothetical protein D557_1771 [Bordetella holmesii 70147]